MEDRKPGICRLCLDIVTPEECQELDSISKDILTVIVPQVNLDISLDRKVCHRCYKTMMRCYTFKTNCNLDNNKERVKTDIRTEIERKCDLCPNNIDVESVAKFESQRTYYNKVIRKCLPDLNLGTTNGTACKDCLETLDCQFTFMGNCLDTEAKLNNYRVNETANGGEKINLYKAVQFILSREFNGAPLNDLDGSFDDFDIRNQTVKMEVVDNKIDEEPVERTESTGVEVKDEKLPLCCKTKVGTIHKTLPMALRLQEGSLTVTELQQLNFSRLSLDEKVAVKKRGRSTPDILISQTGTSNKKKYIRSFNSEWYQRKSWLCGCEAKNALFCFPCLLFGGDATWTKDGFRNINKMKEKTDKHEKSTKHVDNVVSLSLLGTVNIKEKLSEAYRLSIDEHNVNVKKNREILSKIIDCVFFCGNFETPLHRRGRDDKDDTINPGVFRGLINFASKLDSDLKNHLETSAVFKGVPNAIQNEILDCLLQVYHEEIRTEITKSSFVAIIADDTSDVSERTRMVLVSRYVLNGEIFERFWGFFTPENQTADGISERILEHLDIILLGDEQKLVAQTFDGVNVKKAEVQARIKEVYKNAHFVHYYAHRLDIIMRNAASITRNARIFFSNVLAIPTFFSRSPQRLCVLKKHIEVGDASWDINVRTVNKVHENLQPLKNCLTEIQSTSNTNETIAEATGILKYLDDDNFKFWLELFRRIAPLVEIIYDQMQSREISAFKVNECITNFKTAVLELRDSKYCENPSKALTVEAKEVCDCICVDIMDRYSSTKHLVAAKLFDKKCFVSFKNEHPVEEIAVTAKAYPMIDKEKLDTELKVFYRRSDIHEYWKLIELLKFISESKLDDVFSEITKLINILLTVPMITSESERCFSTLKRIKSFLRSAVNSERLNALAVLSMETNFLCSRPEIKEKIIDLFAQTETRKMDFMYK